MFKVTLALTEGTHAALTKEKKDIMFKDFPSTATLAAAVSTELEQVYSDLLDNLEVQEIEDYAGAEEYPLVLQCHTVDGKEVGFVLIEPVPVY